MRSAKTSVAAIFLGLLCSTALIAQQGTYNITSTSATPGTSGSPSIATITLSATLTGGATADGFTVSVMATANGSAPAIDMSNAAFTGATVPGTIPAQTYSCVCNGTGTTMSMFISSLNHPAGGTITLGTLSILIPPTSRNLDTYTLSIPTPPDAGNSVTSTSVPMTSGSNQTISITQTVTSFVKNVSASGDNQTGTAGAGLSSPFAVTVTDVNGVGVAGITVTFTVATGGGNFSGNNSTQMASDRNGNASATLTLGAAAGSNNNTATAAVSGQSNLTFTASGIAGAAAQINPSPLNSATQTGAPNATFSNLKVQVADQFGNAVGSNVSVTFTAIGGGTVSTGGPAASSATGTTNGSGIATVTWTVSNSLSGQSMTAALTSNTNVNTTFSVTIQLATGTTVTGGSAASGTVGQTSTNICAVVNSNGGGTVLGAQVTFTVPNGNTSTFNGNGSQVATSGSPPQACTTLSLTHLAGSFNVTATVTLVSGTATATIPVTATADVAHSIGLPAGGTATPAGTPNSTLSNVSVLVVDQFSNPVNNQSVTFTPTGGTVNNGGVAATNSSGIASINWTLGATLSGQTLSAALTTNPNSVSAFLFTANVQLPAGTTVTAGNPNTASGTVGLTSTNICAVVNSGGAVAGAVVTFSVPNGNTSTFNGNGSSVTTSGTPPQACTTLLLTHTAGNFNVTAAVTTVNGQASGTISVTASAGTAAQISPSPLSSATQTGTPNSSFSNLNVQVADQYGNAVGSNVSVTFTAIGGGTVNTGGGAASSTTGNTNSSGIATVTWNLGNSLSGQSMTAALTSLLSTNTTFTVTVQLPAGTTVTAGTPNFANGTVGQTSSSFCAVVNSGGAVSGATVNFSVPNGNTSTFNGNGSQVVTSGTPPQACTTLSLTHTAGAFNVTAAVTTVNGQVSGTIPITATADVARSIGLPAGGTATPSGTPNSTLSNVSVLVVDQFSNPVNNQSVTFTPTGGTVNNSGVATTNASGIASINWTLGAALSGQTLSAGLTTNPNSVAAFLFTANVQLPAGTTVTAGAPSTASGTVGQTSTSICAVVNSGGAVAGAVVTFSVPNGNTSTFNGNGSQVTTSGTPPQACTTVSLTHTAGAFNVTAAVTTVNGQVSGTIPITATADVARTIGLPTGGTATPSGTPNSTLSNVAVLVVDQFSNPVNNQSIIFTPTGGMVNNSGAATTNSSGIASINWTLGAALSGQTLSAALTPNPNSVSAFLFTANVQLPAGATVTAGTPSSASGTVGQTSSSFCVVVNSSGAVSGAVVTFSVPNGNTSTFTSNNVTTSGTPPQACTTLTLTHTAGNFNVTAAVTTVNGQASGTIPVTAAAGAAASLTPTPNSAPVGAPNSAITGVQVLVADQYGNPINNQGVTFAVTGGGGSVNNGGAATSNASGLATINWTLGGALGGQTMTVTLNPNPNRVASATYTASVQLPVGSTVVAGSPNTASGAAGGTSTNVCAVVNVNSAPVAGVPVAFSVPGGNTSTFTANPVTTATNGGNTQACTTLTLTHTAGAFNVTATVSTVSGTASGIIPLTVNPGTLAQLQYVSGNNQTALTSAAIANPMIVQAADQYGNGITGVSVTFTVTAGGGTVTGGGSSANVATIAGGLASTILTLGSALGANTVQASAASPTSPVSFTATGVRTLSVSNNSLGFSGVLGTSPSSQNLTVSAAGGPLNWTSVSSGPFQVVLTPNSGTTPTNVTVSINPGSLAAGAYTDVITISSTGAAAPQTITVGLSITAPAAIGVSQNNMGFIGQVGGTAPAAQPLQIFGPLSFPTLAVQLSTTTSTGGNWLSVSPLSGTTPFTPSVSVNTSGMASGIYTGTITLVSSNAGNSPLNVSVTLTLAGQPSIQMTPASLSFSGQAGSTNPASQTISLSNGGGGSETFTATASTSDGNPWLSVSGGGVNNASLTVSAALLSLPAGVYNGTIAVIAAGASNTPQMIPVTFTVTAIQGPATLSANAAALLFNTVVNGSPAAQTISLSNSGGGSGSIGFTAVASTVSGGNWLSISPTTSTTPGTVSVAVNTANLAQGGYNGTIVITPLPSANATNSQVVIQVGLAISAPVIEPGGVVNAAIFNTALSPGSIVSLFGVNLSTSTVSAAATPLPTTLGGTQVLVNGAAIPLFYVSPTQVNAQLPSGISGSITITVVSGTATGVTTTVQVAAVSPGIFVVGGPQGQTGTSNSQGAILNSDQSPNSSSNPAPAGSLVVIFATGLGPTTPALADGQPGSSNAPFNTLVNPVLVSINGQNSVVSFEGAAPGFVGLFQINVTIPLGTPSGNAVPVQLSILGVSSNAVTICVQ